jgi:hypothetical protein
MLATSQEQAGISQKRLFNFFHDRVGRRLTRCRVLYRYQRRRNKSLIEIFIEPLAKFAPNKTLLWVLHKAFSRRYYGVTYRTLEKELAQGNRLKEIVTRERLFAAKFFFDSTDQVLWSDYRRYFPDRCETVIKEADRILRHEFDLLGTGPHAWGHPIDWHLDPKSGHRWPKRFYTEVRRCSISGADVKLPYELSRMQHLPTLGKAYRLTGNERYAQELIEQVTHWLDDNSYLLGINWTCAMDVAIRIVNIIWALAFVETSSCVSEAFRKRLLLAIWQHGQYVVRHLEYSVRPDGSINNQNHYLSDVVGLVYLGILFPEFRAAQTWRSIGIESLFEEMMRQVCVDGGHYESSLSYHRLVLELFTSAALLCRLNDVKLSDAFWKRLEDMYSFTLHVTRPDGKVPQVGDADDGRLHILEDYGSWDRTDHRYLLAIGAVLFNRQDMKRMAGAFSEEAFWLLGSDGASKFALLGDSVPALQSKAFEEAGFYVMRASAFYVLACCNPVGTGGAGNHKHNDFLSFDLCVADRPIIVDPGTYVYTASPEWRNTFRSTGYHNTVVIDGQEQNRFRTNTVFSLIADGKPIVHEWKTTSDFDHLDAEHTGYWRLAAPVRHRRIFHLDKRSNRFEITDTLEGKGQHTAEWNFHFDYGVEVKRVNDFLFVAHCGEKVALQLTVTSPLPLDASVEDGWVSRSYGTKLPAKILKLQRGFSDYCRAVCCVTPAND